MFLHSQSISCDISWARMTVVLPVPHTRRGWYSCLLPGVATVLPGGWQRRRCSPAQPSQQHPQNLLPGGLSPERHRRASVLRHRGACTEEGKEGRAPSACPFFPPLSQAVSWGRRGEVPCPGAAQKKQLVMMVSTSSFQTEKPQ